MTSVTERGTANFVLTDEDRKRIYELGKKISERLEAGRCGHCGGEISGHECLSCGRIK